MKFLGCSLIMISCGYFGFSLSNKYAKRLNNLKFLSLALKIIQTEINFGVNILEDIFKMIYNSFEKEGIGKFFLSWSTGLTDGLSVHESFEEANKTNTLHLSKEDMEILKIFSSVLGSSDKKSQEEIISLTLSKLEIQERSASEEYIKNNKMFKSLGILTGILIVIIIL